MRIDIVTVLPELLESPLSHSIMKRAQEKGILDLHIHALRSYGLGPNKQLDDYQYGGGAGLVMMVEPLANCIEDLKSKNDYDEIIYLTPDGSTLNQSIANSLSLKGNLMLICGHYKGIDQRVRDHYITMDISIGDFVMSGGELGACVLVDTVVRLIPGVLNDGSSALFDSFQDDLLAPPIYTRPSEYNGWKVPDILLSGNDKAIDDWRYEQSVERTKTRRPDLLDKE